MKTVIDRRLDDRCHHSAVRDGEGQYRCSKCGLCLVPAYNQSSSRPSSRTIDDLWELIEPKHEPLWKSHGKSWKPHL